MNWELLSECTIQNNEIIYTRQNLRNTINMGNFSDNPSQRGNTERNSMSEIFTICQT